MDKLQNSGEKLWKLFLLNNKGFKDVLILEYKRTKSIDMDAIIKLIKELYLNNRNLFMEIDKREFDCQDTRLYRIIKGYIFYCLL